MAQHETTSTKKRFLFYFGIVLAVTGIVVETLGNHDTSWLTVGACFLFGGIGLAFNNRPY